MHIDLITDPYEITTLITQPVLYSLSHGSDAKIEDFKINPVNFYLGFIEKDLLGVIECKAFTQVTLEAHIHLLPRYWKTGVSIEGIRLAKEYLCLRTSYQTVMTTVPLSCEHIHKLMNAVGFKVAGKVSNSIIYNQKLQDLILYEMSLVS